ncbi:MAG: recombinase family protein [Clostridia bacterium]|jgi:site-specific DNA recombinase|nr:recombinase family protein [Clostridia bacterium]
MKKFIAGLYFRLSQEDERAGESLSIDNQRMILRKYAEENGFEIYGEYIDDGVSGTTFDRPEVQRLLDDAKTGVINTIIVKDLSRFGRNYIEVGQYLDYVFPAFGIRFIAIQDNVDTANRESNAMEMMPIMNVFNEWHAANTSKKIRAVRQSNAKAGIYSAKKASYGYVKGADKKRTPTIDEETAPVVRRIFEMYASGISPKNIADILNAEDIPSPGRYAYEKLGHKGRPNEMRLWCEITIRAMLNNIIYIGHLPMLQETTVSYKNHKRQAKDMSDWVITYNNHEPIISQELWDKVHERMKSVAQGRKTRTGFVHPLSGFLVCADCGAKLKMSGTYSHNKKEYRYHFDCGYHLRYGKTLCFSHYIQARVLEKIILDDIRTMAQRITLDEDAIRKEFERQNEELADKAVKTAKKELQTKKRRIEELSRLMQIAYEDRMKGKMPEDICVEFIQKYSDEKKTLAEEIVALETKLTETETKQQSADDFIHNIKKYLDAPELTREMCYELLDRVVVGGLPKITGKERQIDIVYKVDIMSVLRYKFKK